MSTSFSAGERSVGEHSSCFVDPQLVFRDSAVVLLPILHMSVLVEATFLCLLGMFLSFAPLDLPCRSRCGCHNRLHKLASAAPINTPLEKAQLQTLQQLPLQLCLR